MKQNRTYMYIKVLISCYGENKVVLSTKLNSKTHENAPTMYLFSEE